MILNHEGTKDTKLNGGEAVEALAASVVDAGLKVHRALGPGLLESAYEHCVAHELSRRGLSVARQVGLPLSYEGLTLDVGYRLDLVVENAIILEIKAVESLEAIHTAQLLTYLKLSGLRLGFLMNFNVSLFKSGLKRVVN
jgi:GxxExxY protein